MVWPYHYSIARSLGRTKYYHISAVVISVFLPLIAVTAVYASDEISRGVATLFPALPGNPLCWRSGRGLGMISGISTL